MDLVLLIIRISFFFLQLTHIFIYELLGFFTSIFPNFILNMPVGLTSSVDLQL